MGNHIGAWNIHRARKPHRCDWCSKSIMPGDYYRARFMIWDDSPWTMKVHPECAVAEACYDYDGEELQFPMDFERGHTHELNYGTIAHCAAAGCPACLLVGKAQDAAVVEVGG